MNIFSATCGLSHDPSESISNDGQTKYCTMSLSCGNKANPAYIDAVAFGKLAELILQYKKKGHRMHVVGHFESKKRQDSTFKLVLVVTEAEFLGAKDTNE